MLKKKKLSCIASSYLYEFSGVNCDIIFLFCSFKDLWFHFLFIHSSCTERFLLLPRTQCTEGVVPGLTDNTFVCVKEM